MPSESASGQLRALQRCPLHDHSSPESGSPSALLLCRKRATSRLMHRSWTPTGSWLLTARKQPARNAGAGLAVPPIPPLFRADTAAFEPKFSWCPEQRKSVGSHSVLEAQVQRSHRWPGGPGYSGHLWRAYTLAPGSASPQGWKARTPMGSRDGQLGGIL